MNFSVRIANYQKNAMLNICDADLLGKQISENKINVHISESYYGEKLVDKKEAEDLLKNSSIINMVGKETISLSINLGIGTENGVKLIDGIPFLIVFKM